jgi:FdhD protein
VTVAFREAERIIWRSPGPAGVADSRRVPEETPVAFSYEGVGYAVMMATPTDLEDFALGFSLNERIIRAAGEIEALDIVTAEHGIVLRMELAEGSANAFWRRRRRIAGPSGCGLCGIESLAEAVAHPAHVGAGFRVTAAEIFTAMQALPELQPVNSLTGALHAAAFWTPGDGIVLVREDVGRHNALDKLTGAAARAGRHGGDGAVLLTSRVSVEMVQKAAAFGAAIVVAVSAPTTLALHAADEAGITLIGIARRDGFEVFTHPHRVDFPV